MILGERDETKRNWVLCSQLYYKKRYFQDKFYKEIHLENLNNIMKIIRI